MRGSFRVLVIVLLVCMAACGSAAADGGPTGSGTTAPTPYPTPVGGLGHRPSTPVKITLLAPPNREVVHGTTLVVRVSVTGGVVTTATTSDITPTKGHVHLYLNNQLILMSYTLSQPITVQPGLGNTMYPEFLP